MEYQKAHSASKQVTTKSPKLKATILNTMKTISDIVGGTLGPGGQPVLIERQDSNLGPMVTKDGVTVFKSLGFQDAASHCIMEAARDAAVRTATEAGDGTTTATILSESIVRQIFEFCEKNPQVSPQKIVRRLEDLFKTVVEPSVKKWTTKATLNTPKDLALLKSVATISANGDVALAEAVMKCFDITGDAGNVTITEAVGPSRYEIEKIDGYPIPTGYDESCMKYYSKFINDPGSGAVIMDKPIFLLYHGKLTEIQTISSLMERISEKYQSDSKRYNDQTGEYTDANVVIVACGFSETVIASLAANFERKDTINVFPVLAPLTAQMNGQMLLLQDLQAITGAKIFDPLSQPIERGSVDDLGPGVECFQSGRTKCVVLGYADPGLLEMRIEEVQRMLESPESELDGVLLKERVAKLSGGIAKLRIWGSSNGELKEKKDRAEDAVCAVKGALNSGVLPGGGWTLINLMMELDLMPEADNICHMFATALKAPVNKLQSNCGLSEAESNDIWESFITGVDGKNAVYDYLNHKFVDAFEAGILDSTPAVLEAIRSSLSIASLLGTLGGTVVFARDHAAELQEARSAADWNRNANVNEADERA